MRAISLLVLSLTLVALPLAAMPAQAAAKPCNIVAVLEVAVQTGTIPPGAYPVSCLYKAKRAAAKDADLATYSNVDQVLAAAIARAGGAPRPPTAGVATAGETGPSHGQATGTTPRTHTKPSKTVTTTPAKTATTTTPNPTKNVTRTTAAVTGKPAGDGGKLPAPVIALGVVAAAALVAAGAVELRRRRSG